MFLKTLSHPGFYISLILSRHQIDLKVFSVV